MLAPTSSCPDENTLASFVESGGASVEARGVVQHLDGCERCRELVALLARTASDDGAAQRVGRFVLLKAIGEGATGVVFAAYDPQLDRKVAIKVLHPASDEPTHQGALREAQAMARLQHHHVVTVHEVGTVGGDVFIAMELIDGSTLRRWLADRRPSPREALKVLLEAGEGLAAAHRAGLVHRDFKPDNVLIGADGRVRVSDFGLAKAFGAPSPRDAAAPPPEAAETRTLTGARVGTPAYMAPEQHRGAPADARADQFSFCVATYEALVGASPLTATGDASAATFPAHVPAKARVALARGLSTDPARRWPAMEPLLEALAEAYRPARRWPAVAALAALAVAAAAFVALRPAPGCVPQAQRLAGIWDDARRADTRKAYLATGKPYAQAAVARVEGALDGFTQRWLAMGQAACEAHRAGAQSDALYGLRTLCLSRRLDDLRALTDVLVAADDAVVQSEGRARHLDRALAGCADAVALLADPEPTDASERTAAEAVRALLAKATALQELGRYRDARAIADQAAAAAKPLRESELTTRAVLLAARLAARSGDGAAAEQQFIAGAEMAARLHRDDLLATAWVQLIGVVGVRRGQPEKGLVWGQAAAAAIARAGGDLELEGTVANDLAVINGNLGRADEALKQAERALDLRTRAFGPDDTRVAASHLTYSVELSRHGRHEEAGVHLGKALAVERTTFGVDHPRYALALHALGNHQSETGARSEAVESLKTAGDIWERGLGPDHQWTLGARSNLAHTLYELGRHDEALVLFDRTIAGYQKMRDKNAAELAEAQLNRLLVLGAKGELQPALEQATALQAEAAKGFPPEHPVRGQALATRGTLLRLAGRCAEAIEPLHQAIAQFEKSHGAHDPRLAQPVASLGLCEKKRELLDRALGFGPVLTDGDRAAVSSQLTAP